MRKLFPFLMLFGLLLVTACDSDSKDSASDSDKFVGGWQLGGLSDGAGDRTAAFAQGYEAITISFTQAGAVTLSVNAADINPVGDSSYSGTYSVVESSKTLNVSLSVNGTPTPLSFTYNFVNDNTATLTASSSTALLLGVLFATSFTEPVTITVVR